MHMTLIITVIFENIEIQSSVLVKFDPHNLLHQSVQ